LAALWLLAAAIALEVHARLWERTLEARATTRFALEQDAAERRDQALLDEAMAWLPQDPKRAMPSREAFLTRDEAGRRDLAADRSELFLLADATAVLQAIYCPPVPPQLAALAERVHVGEPLWLLFDDASALSDARGAFRVATDGASMGGRDYPFYLREGQEYFAEATFMPLNEGIEGSDVILSLSPSTYKRPAFSFQPNVYRGEGFPRYEFYTNSHGFRDDEVALPKPQGGCRILCIGGSTTVLGLRNELTYPNLVERMLREHFHTDRIEVVNCGVSGLGTDGQREQVHSYLALEPDLMLFYVFFNDITNNYHEFLTVWAANAGLLPRIKRFLSTSSFLYWNLDIALLPPEEELIRFFDQGTLANLRAMAAEAEQAGTDMAVCSFAGPDLRNDRHVRAFFEYQLLRTHGRHWGMTARAYQHVLRLFNRRIEVISEQEGWLYVPVAEHMQGAIGVFSDLCHVYQDARRHKATIVADYLKNYVAERLGKAVPSP